MNKKFKQFTISQKAILIRDNKVLILRCSYCTRRWDLPGGKIDEDEMSEDAFRRELKEELGFSEFNILATVDYGVWQAINGENMCGIVNLIENDNDNIVLSSEHSDYKFISEAELDDYKFVWPKMKRMIKNGFEYYKNLSK